VLNPTRAAALQEALRVGCTRRTAPALAGIHFVTFYRWLERGRASRAAKRPPNRYTRLLDLVERAEAEVIFDCLLRIRGGHDSWQSAAWLLERLRPEEWGVRARRRTPSSPIAPMVQVIRTPARRPGV
jgi:hypothetical protein